MLREEYHGETPKRRVDIMEERSQSMQARIGARVHDTEERMEQEHPQVVKALEDTAMNHHSSLVKQKEA
eukprot:12915151-Prorocentrum_lima.AAC.1